MAPSHSARRRGAAAVELPDLRALHCFVTVAERGSVRQAAAGLALSTSAVSQTLLALEQQFGVTLLDRSQRPLVPSAAGQRLLPAAREVLARARLLQPLAAGAADGVLAGLRMGCVDSFAATIGPELVRGLSGVVRDVRMYAGITPQICGQLLRREIDVAISTDPLVQSPQIQCRALFSEAWVAVFPQALGPARLRRFADLARLADTLPLIRYSLRSVIGTQIERFLAHVGVQAPDRFQFDTTDPLLSLVAGGSGWALSSPLCLLQSRHHLPHVRVLTLPPSTEGRRHFYLLWHEDMPARLGRDIHQICRQVLRHRIVPAMEPVVAQPASLFGAADAGRV